MRGGSSMLLSPERTGLSQERTSTSEAAGTFLEELDVPYPRRRSPARSKFLEAEEDLDLRAHASNGGFHEAAATSFLDGGRSTGAGQQSIQRTPLPEAAGDRGAGISHAEVCELLRKEGAKLMTALRREEELHARKQERIVAHFFQGLGLPPDTVPWINGGRTEGALSSKASAFDSDGTMLSTVGNKSSTTSPASISPRLEEVRLVPLLPIASMASAVPDVDGAVGRGTSPSSWAEEVYNHSPAHGWQSGKVVPESGQDSPYHGEWVDREGGFFGGAVVKIGKDRWRPILKQQDLAKPEAFVKRAVGPNVWTLAEVGPDGAERCSYRLEPGPEDSLVAMEESGTTYILHRAGTASATRGRAEEAGLAWLNSDGESDWLRSLMDGAGANSAQNDQLGLEKPPLAMPGEDFLLRRWEAISKWTGASREPERKGRMSRLVQSYMFEAVSFAVILCNCAFIVMKVNCSMDPSGEAAREECRIIWQELDAFELFFLAFYCVELTLRLIVNRWSFFLGEDQGWNLLDTIVVAATFTERMTPASSSRSFLRVLRVFKVVRLLRLARGSRSFMAPARLLLEMMTRSFFAFARCVTLLVFVIFVFALLLTQEVSAHLASLSPDSRREPVAARMKQDFGSVPASVLSLFMAVSNGDAWMNQYNILQEIDSTFVMTVYLAFILFFVVVFWNILTGQFVFETLQMAAPNIDELMLQRRQAGLRTKWAPAGLDLHTMDFELRLMHQRQLSLWRRGLTILERIDARQEGRQTSPLKIKGV